MVPSTRAVRPIWATLYRQSAAGRADAMTTQRDMCWTDQDVLARVEPSLHVLRAWLEWQTRDCEHFCLSVV
jgi:hypothetical protein